MLHTDCEFFFWKSLHFFTDVQTLLAEDAFGWSNNHDCLGGLVHAKDIGGAAVD